MYYSIYQLMKTRNNYLRTVVCFFLMFVVVIVYWQVTTFDFVNFDDPEYIYENKNVIKGITFRNIHWAFTSFKSGHWHPVTWLSHMLDINLFGKNPGLHHLTNLCFHIVNVILFFLFLSKTTNTVLPGLFASILLAVHPLHVESVAWITGRKDLLSTFFLLITLHLYASYSQKSNLNSYIVTLLCFIVGIMSKSMLTTLPFVLLLLDYWPLKRLRLGQEIEKIAQHNEKQSNVDVSNNIRPIVIEKIPFFIFALIFCLIAVKAQTSISNIKSLDTLPVYNRFFNILVSYSQYILKLLYPINLAVFYPYIKTINIWKVVLSAAILIPTTFLILLKTRKYPFLFVGWFWFIGTMLPVSGVIQVGSQGMADRYTYMPFMGLYILISWGLYEMIVRQKNNKNVYIGLIILLTPLLMIRTRHQTQFWKNSFTLFQHTLSIVESVKAHNNFGLALAEKLEYDKAVLHYKKALIIDPNYSIAAINLGIALSIKGNFEDAAYYFLTAIKNNPHSFEANFNLGQSLLNQGKLNEALKYFLKSSELSPGVVDSYTNIGDILFRKGRYDEAEKYYVTALSIEPNNASTYNSLGKNYFQQRKINESIKSFIKALDINPDFVESHDNLGTVLYSIGKTNESLDHFLYAIKINPDFSNSHYNLGVIYSRLNDSEKAIKHYSKAIKIKPDDEAANSNLANIYSRKGEYWLAIKHYNAALKINPDNHETHNNLGLTYKKMKEYDKATNHFYIALKIKPGFEKAKKNLNLVKKQKK